MRRSLSIRQAAMFAPHTTTQEALTVVDVFTREIAAMAADESDRS